MDYFVHEVHPKWANVTETFLLSDFFPLKFAVEMNWCFVLVEVLTVLSSKKFIGAKNLCI